MRPSVALALVLAATSAADQAASAGLRPLQRLDFVIRRDGQPVGTHRVAFLRESEFLRVESITRCDSAGTGRLRQRVVERLRHGRLEAMRAETDCDGALSRVEIRRAAGRAVIIRDGAALACAPDPAVAASLWNAGIVAHDRLIDPGDGRRLAVAFRGAGTDPLDLPQGRTLAWRFVAAGDLERELWYDESGTPLRARHVAPDGTEIVYAPA